MQRDARILSRQIPGHSGLPDTSTDATVRLRSCNFMVARASERLYDACTIATVRTRRQLILSRLVPQVLTVLFSRTQGVPGLS